MSVGNQLDKETVDSTLTQLAVGYRELASKAMRLQVMIEGHGDPQTVLESIGYDATANTANPGEQSDAAWAQQCIDYLYTLAGVYHGTVQQGGSGGTGASTFDFHNALSLLWGDQVLRAAALGVHAVDVGEERGGPGPGVGVAASLVEEGHQPRGAGLPDCGVGAEGGDERLRGGDLPGGR